jgi:hypothetical protein
MTGDRNWEQEFEDIDFYPGSSRPIVRHQQPKPTASEPNGSEWDSAPRIYTVNGTKEEFFTVGQLAQALNRQAVTVRKWERDGVIPKAVFIAPSDDPRGKRRLYTRQQVEGMARIAAEEGVLLVHQKPIGQTKFTERVLDLFRTLKGPGQ